jgi:YVTN family beta-propeller protein
VTLSLAFSTIVPAAALSPSSTTVTVGYLPAGVAVDSATNRIYVANGYDATVSVINGATNQVVKTVPVPTGTPVGTGAAGVAINQVHNRIYVTNYATDGQLIVIDGNTEAVMTKVALNQSDPLDVAVNPSTNVVYVANQTGNAKGQGTLSVVSGSDNHLNHTRVVGAFLRGMVDDPKTDTVYIGNLILGTVTVYDGKTNSVSRTVTLPDTTCHPDGMAMDLGRNLLYVSCFQIGVVYVLNGATGQVVKTITGLALPEGIALDTANQLAYVANSASNTVAVVNTQTGNITKTLPTGPQPDGVAFNPVTGHIYVTDSGDSSVTIY